MKCNKKGCNTKAARARWRSQGRCKTCGKPANGMDFCAKHLEKFKINKRDKTGMVRVFVSSVAMVLARSEDEAWKLLADELDMSVDDTKKDVLTAGFGEPKAESALVAFWTEYTPKEWAEKEGPRYFGALDQ